MTWVTYFPADLEWHPFSLCPQGSILLGPSQSQQALFKVWSDHDNSSSLGLKKIHACFPARLWVVCSPSHSLFLVFSWKAFVVSHLYSDFSSLTAGSSIYFYVYCQTSGDTHKFLLNVKCSQGLRHQPLMHWLRLNFCIMKVSSWQGWSGFFFCRHSTSLTEDPVGAFLT